MESVLGPSLTTKSGEAVSTSAALAGAKFVGVYFSAHWCGPCRAFTPKLSAFLSAHGARLGLRVVFVSRDESEEAFRGYFEGMAADLALPPGSEHAKRAGANVRSIPTLNLFDAATGALMAEDLYEALTLDGEGAYFPWTDAAPGWAAARPGIEAAWVAARDAAVAGKGSVAMAAPPHAHPLLRSPGTNHTCDCCGASAEFFFSCKACEYDECESCFVKRGGSVPKQPSIEDLLGPSLTTKSGAAVATSAALAGAKVVGVYFSAHWCGPCRGFTPKLSAFFSAHAERLGLRVVFVSSDRDEAAFKGYFGEMAWDLALPFEDEHKDVVGGDVRGIPTLKLFDAATGALIAGDARGSLNLDAEGAFFPWAAGTPGWAEARAGLEAKAKAEWEAAKAEREAALTAHLAAKMAAPPHEHALSRTPNRSQGRRCDCCHATGLGHYFSCKPCDYDECEACFVKRGGKVEA